MSAQKIHVSMADCFGVVDGVSRRNPPVRGRRVFCAALSRSPSGLMLPVPNSWVPPWRNCRVSGRRWPKAQGSHLGHRARRICGSAKSVLALLCGGSRHRSAQSRRSTLAAQGGGAEGVTRGCSCRIHRGTVISWPSWQTAGQPDGAQTLGGAALLQPWGEKPWRSTATRQDAPAGA